MTKKELEIEEKNSKKALDLIMRHLGLDIYIDGTIVYTDDDDDFGSAEPILIDGMPCKYIGYPVDKTETTLEVYNNPKYTHKLLLWYIARNRWGIDIMSLTNRKPDTLGRLEIKFSNEVTYTSHVYKKDSLKYIDMVMLLEQVPEYEFAELKELDIE